MVARKGPKGLFSFEQETRDKDSEITVDSSGHGSQTGEELEEQQGPRDYLTISPDSARLTGVFKPRITVLYIEGIPNIGFTASGCAKVCGQSGGPVMGTPSGTTGPEKRGFYSLSTRPTTFTPISPRLGINIVKITRIKDRCQAVRMNMVIDEKLQG
ncbi:hypothetical protein PCH_Pc22g11990 [Penicillium rubens Wisconsin 54-1255]|uniref:Uncharacterized protein n=1 Tax=Penicillium rubens (strain ATCC 28089 / DSM 1075 / NRRL 1951 / Wisconsin 54-1255) TaxID=500485 RepID=B6HR16_PENRW|nr:hypothetical protein PCH_Pc22g11990 [Penicillium rubens Wisconsin 54-1255]